MQRQTAHVMYRSVTILVLCSGIIHGRCPSGMIRVGRLCYKWYASALSVKDAIITCKREGGNLAGFENGNFLETIEKNPLLEKYLPKEYCFWAVLPSPGSRLSNIWLLKSVVPDSVMEGFIWALHFFTHSLTCYDKTEWVVYSADYDRGYNFVCEHEVSLFEEDRRRGDVREVKLVRMQKEAAFIADQPLFAEGAPVPTMCSRLCQEFTGCSMFNYNKLTKQCRGFGVIEDYYIHYHQDWEVWMFE